MRKFLLFSLLFSVVACPQLNAMEDEDYVVPEVTVVEEVEDSSYSSCEEELVGYEELFGDEEEFVSDDRKHVRLSWCQKLTRRFFSAELNDDGYARVYPGILTRPVCRLFRFLFTTYRALMLSRLAASGKRDRFEKMRDLFGIDKFLAEHEEVDLSDDSSEEEGDGEETGMLPGDVVDLI